MKFPEITEKIIVAALKVPILRLVPACWRVFTKHAYTRTEAYRLQCLARYLFRSCMTD